MTDRTTEAPRVEGLEHLDNLSALLEKPADNAEAYERKLDDLGGSILELYRAHGRINELIDTLQLFQYTQEKVAARMRLDATVLIGGNDSVNDHNALLLLLDAVRVDTLRTDAGRQITELMSARERVRLGLKELTASARSLRTQLQELTIQQVARCARQRVALQAGTRCVRAPRDPRELPDSGSVSDAILVSRAKNDFEILRRQIRQANQTESVDVL